MPYPLPLTRTEAYLAYKAGVIQQSDLKPSLSIPRNGIDAWLAYWTGLTTDYPVKNVGKNLFNTDTETLVFIDSSGNIIAGLVWSCSDYIKVSPNTTYTWHGEHTGSLGGQVIWAGYDSSKVFISGQYAQVNNTTGTSFTTGASTEYVRVGYRNDRLQNMQLELGSTATAYEPYTGEPLILQEEEAYIAYLSGVINEYPEKCLRRVGAYLRYIISARWGRPDHPLNREELYLSLIKTQVIPSGDPSSDIVIDGTAKAAFQDVKMYGDTYQQTYTGKNLFNKNNPNMFVGYVGWNGAINSTSADRMIYIPCEPSTTYSIQKPIPTTNPKFRVAVSTDVPANGGTATVLTNDTYMTLGEATVTTKADSAYLMVYIWVNSSEMTLDEVLSGIQIEVGSSVTSYEPYVGGQASPNPDYPQIIQTVTGEQAVEVQGKNLFRAKDGQYRDNTLTVDVENGVIHVYGHQHVAYDQNIWIPVEDIHADGTYTLTMNYSGSGGGAFRLTKDKSYQAANNFGGTYYAPNRDTPVTASATDITYNWILIYLGHGSSLSEVDYYINPQFESGSLSTTFSPYSKHTYPINLGKNLFDIDQYTKTIHGAEETTITKPNDNTLRVTNTKAGTYRYSMTPLPDTNAVLGKTITLKVSAKLVNASSGGIRFYWASNQWYTTALGDWVTFTEDGEYTVTVTVPSNPPSGSTRLCVSLYGSATVSSPAGSYIDYSDIQVEVGSVATSYAPYFAPIELCKLGDYQDYIYKDGEDWKVHKAVSSITLNGTEGWVYADNYNYARCPSYIFVNKPLGGTGVGLQLSNYFRVITDWGTFRDSTSRNAFFPLLDEGYKISIRNTGCTSAESYKSWLSANKPSFYYPVETPTDTVIANQALIDQLDALVDGGAENGTTYIKVNATDPNLPGLLYVEAPKYE